MLIARRRRVPLGRTALSLGALLVAAALSPVVALGDVPVHPPATAKKMTKRIAESGTWERAIAERSDESRWPVGARVTVSGCVDDSRHVGSCDYTLDAPVVDPQTGVYTQQSLVCHRHVIVTIKKRTHRVTSRVRDRGCETG